MNGLPDFNFSIKDCHDIAEAKVGIQGWSAYRWTRLEDDALIEGCVPDGVYARGPRKGRPRYNGKNVTHQKKVAVTKSELQAAAKAYETAEGKCWDCKGTGKTFSGWSAAEGTTYRPCARCVAIARQRAGGG